MQLKVIERFYRWGNNNDKLRIVLQYDRALYKSLLKAILNRYPNTCLPVWKLKFVIFVSCHAPALSYAVGCRRRLFTMVYQKIGKSRDIRHLDLLLVTHLELGSLAIVERRWIEADFQIDLLNRVIRLCHLTPDKTQLLRRTMCYRVVQLRNLPPDHSNLLFHYVENFPS